MYYILFILAALVGYESVVQITRDRKASNIYDEAARDRVRKLNQRGDIENGS